MDDYQEFLKSKRKTTIETGFSIEKSELNPVLFEFQKDIVRWAVNRGKAAIFAMTGLGKTLMQVEFTRVVTEHENCKALIVAPLAVSKQTIKIAKQKMGIEITELRDHHESIGTINIINYEQLHNIDSSMFDCIVLDESSILKNYSGKIRNEIIDMFRHCRYKLPCTATPAPNDFMELGNHSEFLDQMTRNEMLSMFFIHDASETQTWRLKGHAEDVFWGWVASWAAIITKPSDLGYKDDKFKLPPLNIISHVIKSSHTIDGHLFAVEANTLSERRDARKITTDERVKLCANIVNQSDESFLVWCDLNYESDMLKHAIDGAVEVKGADSIEHKEKSMLDFADDKLRVLVSKPSICGHGMNFQVSHNMAFVGLSDSFEQYFQAVRREWRFGQKKPVNVHVITSDIEGAVVQNIKRKEEQASKMIEGMVEHTKKYVMENIKHNRNKTGYGFKKIEMKLPVFLREVA
jgi:superfamily II DNA or RNA helicase